MPKILFYRVYKKHPKATSAIKKANNLGRFLYFDGDMNHYKHGMVLYSTVPFCAEQHQTVQERAVPYCIVRGVRDVQLRCAFL